MSLDVFLALSITLGVVAVCVVLHYEVLRGLLGLMERMSAISPRQRILVLIGGALVAHFAEIVVFSIGYYLLIPIEGQNVLTGRLEGDVFDYLYFSAATYTTLGIGDVFPLGIARLVAGIESLTGLILITWTASFTYLAMREFWDMHALRRARKKRSD